MEPQSFGMERRPEALPVFPCSLRVSDLDLDLSGITT